MPSLKPPTEKQRREANRIAMQRWREENREHARQYLRDYRARRAAAKKKGAK